MLLFCCLCWPCFLLVSFRPVSCVSLSFCCATLVFGLLMNINSVTCPWFGTFCLFLCFFWLVCYVSFCFALFLLLPSVTNIVAWAPVGTFIPYSRAPPCRICPLHESPPFVGIHAPLGLRVCLLLVIRCVFDPYAHIGRPCAGVFAGVFGVYMCVLGVCQVSMGP